LIYITSFVLVMSLGAGVAVGGVDYEDPPGGWTYIYTGDSAAPGGGFTALDGTWSHNNGSDQWDETEIGSGRPGGVSILSEDNVTFVRLQDTGDPRDYGMYDPSNRKIFFGHSVTNDIRAVANTLLDDGVTISFRARLSTRPPLDRLYPPGGSAILPWPTGGDGYLVHDGGKDNFGIRQPYGNKLISFALSLASDDYELSSNGLTMNKLNGTSPTGDVDLQGNEPGVVNILEIADLTVWHEFWITIQADTSGGGTHKVKVYVDESSMPTEFNVTAGTGNDYDNSYISLGVGATPQSGAIDVDFYAYKEGITNPVSADPEKARALTPPPGAIVGQELSQLSWSPGESAVSHDVYFGDNFDDVDAGRGGTFQGNQTGTVFTVGVAEFPYPDGLLPGKTYFWRIDEIEADGTTIHKGEVWSFTVLPSLEGFESNNFSTFPWEHQGDAIWTIISYEKHSGTCSAQAGTIEHDESSTLRVRLRCISGDITFYRKVSSESGCDYLEFYIDGVRKSRWSGAWDWDQVSFPVSAGTRIFEWTYSKDGSISSDGDTAWIDDIVFPIGADTIPTGEVIELTDAIFDQIVLSSDVPVLVDFWAPWCEPCLTMAPVIEEIADEYAGRIKVCKLNVDNEPQTTTNYGIRFIPTFILFKDGQVQRQWVGVTGKNELTAAIDELL
jgi:thioredoxin 1